MKRLMMYMHGGSENHGCEAIVRSTINLFDVPTTLYSRDPAMDFKYKIDDICKIECRGETIKRFGLKWLARQLRKRVFGDKLALIRNNYCNIIKEADNDNLYLSIGGDNYCGDLVPALQYVNEQLNSTGAGTVLWGCSIDPEFIEKKENHADLARYTRIFAREKTTYQALINSGFKNISRYYPDPAFTLEQEKWNLPKIFYNAKVVGINISPYVQKNGKENIVFESYKNLINYIIAETDYTVALIPHVVWPESDDRIPLRQLYNLFKNERVIYVDDRNCMQLKYCIAHCDILVAARTHASIAGYSTCVPTLVVGYSMKSLAIAKDIFKEDKHFVVPAAEMETGRELLDAFQWLFKHQEEIRCYLKDFMPEYIECALHSVDEIQELLY